jgi:inositol-phosphate phosphatase/L-galactose 1-phosphate phosphatase/histidinol-phosphatase
MSSPCSQVFVDFADRLADIARTIVRRAYRTPVAIAEKPDGSPVTETDRKVETALRQEITKTFPDHGVIGEEAPPTLADAEYVWVIDPIDGTKAFVCGLPVFGTLLALTRADRPILGLIDQPITEERWLGALGRATTWNGQPVHTRRCPTLKHAFLCATSPEMFVNADQAAFARVRAEVKVARYGTDCYAYGLLASGLIDLVVEAQLSPYDYLAHIPIIHGAGGLMTDWAGRELRLGCGATQVIAAGDSTVHRIGCARLASAP